MSPTLPTSVNVVMHLPPKTRLLAAFTLVEMMVSMAIIAILGLILVQLTSQTSSTWQYTTRKTEEFRDARRAFEAMSRKIGQATLNTYWDYQYNGTQTPVAYGRQSELQFVCGGMQSATGTSGTNGAISPLLAGTKSATTPLRPTHGIFFQAPLGYVAPGTSNDTTTYNGMRGLDNLLNTWGYYIEVNDDQSNGQRPSFLSTSDGVIPVQIRSRLMEFMQPSNDLSVYQYTLPAIANPPTATTTAPIPFNWFTDALSTPAGSTAVPPYHVLSENIIALVILPKLSKQDAGTLTKLSPAQQDVALAPNYFYNSGITGEVANSPLLNSRNQLPPVVQVTMVAIDEGSAQRMMPTMDQAQTFVQSTLKLPQRFLDASKFQTDLQSNPSVGAGAGGTSLEDALIANRINYRIFTTNVSIRAAKWSQATTK